MRSVLSIAAYSVLSKMTTPTGECARNDRRISRTMLSNSVRIEGATAKTGWKESSDIKSRRRRRMKVEALNSMQMCHDSSCSGYRCGCGAQQYLDWN